MTDVSEPNEAMPDEAVPGEPTGGESKQGDAGHQLFSLADQREEAIEAAQLAVRAGKCIVLPTDTVYGIGADAFSAQAVQGLLEAKHRGRDMPPPVLIAEPAMLPALVAYVPLNARAMIERFWPGALTLIFRAQSSLHLDLGDTDGTIAVRVPDNDAARELLRHTGPLAVSSANISGSPSAKDVADAEAMLGDSVEVYLDGGPTPGPVASTIVDFTQNPSGRILRAGVIGFEELHELSGGLEDLPQPEPPATQEPDDPGEQPQPEGTADQPESGGTADQPQPGGPGEQPESGDTAEQPDAPATEPKGARPAEEPASSGDPEPEVPAAEPGTAAGGTDSGA